jgi:crotonobetainyl-CoA:carnitine CoA-transferase CaiB-like acyl-CoA transferase
MADKPRHVLDGYRVLDFTQFLAGPTVTRMMAEMGAEIIKVEIAPIGDYSRSLPFMHDGRSAYYIQQSRQKEPLHRRQKARRLEDSQGAGEHS